MTYQHDARGHFAYGKKPPRTELRRLYEDEGNNILDSASAGIETLSHAGPLANLVLWSLLDMLRLYAEPFARAMRALTDDMASLDRIIDSGGGAELVRNVPDLFPRLAAGMRDLMWGMGDLPLCAGTREIAAIYVNRISTSAPDVPGSGDPWLTVIEARSNIDMIHNAILGDLRARVFLAVNEERAAFYDPPEPPFGPLVAKKFDDLNDDIAAASRCIALEEWDAAIFHLMRVHELALRRIADKLGVPVAKDKTLVYQDWQRIITEIETLVKAVRSPSKVGGGAPSARKKELYGEIAVYLFHIKDLWRVPYLHARATSSERKAMIVWENTRALMELLATRKLL